ncbi:MAG: metal-dependent transcriptional regulator [Akkermansiaceae bacterium]|jgi:DtxR family Mn-dependent transcriptional regulator
MPTSTVENYLKAIWNLQGNCQDDELVPVGQVAERLEVTPGTATTMMNQLQKKGLVDYTSRRGVRLNEKGRLAAMDVLRRHRLVETFLVEIMKFDWAEVHEDAEVLEHVVSDRLLERMDEMLQHPTHDPHGSPIPGPDGELGNDGTMTILANCEPGEYVLRRVRDNQASFLQWLSDHELKPGVSLALAERNAAAETLTLVVEGSERPLQIALTAARSLLVSNR